jgi:hypothetical protein
VFSYVATPLAVTVIWAKGPDALALRSTLNPVSSAELSVHVSVMLLADEAAAFRFDGAAGAGAGVTVEEVGVEAEATAV